MQKILLWLVLISFLSICCQARKWTQIGASKKKSANLVGMDIKYVRLESKSGKKSKMLISSLSEKDKKYLRKVINSINPQPQGWSYTIIRRVTAKYQTSYGSRVTLKKSNGETLSVSLGNLSSADQKYVEENRSSSSSSTTSRRGTLGRRSSKRSGLRSVRSRKWSIKETKHVRGTLFGVDGKNLIIQIPGGKKTIPLKSPTSPNVKAANLILARAVQNLQAERIAKAARGKKGEKGKPVQVAAAPKKPVAGNKVNPAFQQPKGGQGQQQVAQQPAARRAPRGRPGQVVVPQVQIQQPVVVPVNKKRSSFRSAMPSGVMGFVTFFVANIVAYVICLWCAMKISKCESSIFALLVSSVVVSFLSLFSIIGLLLSGIVQLGLIMWISKTNFIDTFFMLIVGNIFYSILFFVVVVPLMVS